MSRFAIVHDGIVLNVIEAEAGFEPATGVLVPDPSGQAEPGGRYVGGVFARVPAEEPAQGFPDLLPYQFQAVLDLGGLRATAEAAIAAIPDAAERIVADSRFRYSQLYRRDDPLFVEMAAAAGLTDAEVDPLWLFGLTL